MKRRSVNRNRRRGGDRRSGLDRRGQTRIAGLCDPRTITARLAHLLLPDKKPQ
jgi:hypothetical protein